jgi:predicted NUDIX family NTP pyrophosphohydrolase
MPKISAGIVLFRRRPEGLQFLLAHAGGPFWKNKDIGAWSIPKGEVDDGEDLFSAARREFAEETGMEVSGKFIELRPIKQKGGKIVHAWGCEQDFDTSKVKSNTFSMEWPPKSGKQSEFPEIDRVEWFSFEETREKINAELFHCIQELNQKAQQ